MLHRHVAAHTFILPAMLLNFIGAGGEAEVKSMAPSQLGFHDN